MVLNFAHDGETLTDQAFARRIRRYYWHLRAGADQREAHRRAMAEVDRYGFMEGESDDSEKRKQRILAANKAAVERRRQYRPRSLGLHRRRSDGGSASFDF